MYVGTYVCLIIIIKSTKVYVLFVIIRGRNLMYVVLSAIFEGISYLPTLCIQLVSYILHYT